MDLQPLRVNHDFRGVLVEAFKFPVDGQVFYVIANPGETRGNHYHLKKTERFLVIYGSARIVVKDRETSNVMQVETSGAKPMVATVAPNNTHAITAGEDGCIFMVWCDQVFDKKNPDTYPEEI